MKCSKCEKDIEGDKCTVCSAQTDDQNKTQDDHSDSDSSDQHEASCGHCGKSGQHCSC